ncbi:MAG: TetR/AcrR family transcriptional regulator [Lachnospiraceae bacterium]|nr:TetR/AcrR family transcriptional regulator [Lachnospiraceae bacterium]
MPRITKTPEERKLEIVKTALELFSEKGYENTTIQDIAEHMNVSQGLCYRYFKSKQEIFAAASAYYAMQSAESMNQPFRENAGAIEKLNTVIGNLFAFALKNSEFEATYNKEVSINTERIQKLALYIADTVIPIVEQGNDEGVFHCENIPNTIKLLSFGIINLIHYDMPTEHVQQHIQSFIPTIIKACKDLLRCEDNNIGAGWNQIK